MPRWIDRLFTRPGPDAGRAVLLSLEPLDARDVPALLSLNLPVSLPIDIPLVARVLATTASLGLVELSTGSAGLGLGVLPGVPTSPPVLPTPEVPTPEVPTPPDTPNVPIIPTPSPASPAIVPAIPTDVPTTPADAPPAGTDSVTPTPVPPIVVLTTRDNPTSPAAPSPTPSAPTPSTDAPATTPAPVVRPTPTALTTPSATTASDAPAAAPLVSFAPLPAEPKEAAATTTAAARAVAASGESPTTATPAVTPPPVLIVPDDVPVDPDFTPPAAPPVPVPDTPVAPSPAPPTDFAVDAAELLDRFFPFDLAGLRAQAQAVFDDLGAALPDADDLLGERGWWYAAALAAMLATRRGVARRARGRGYRRSLR